VVCLAGRHALSGRAASLLCAEGRVAEMDVLVVCDAGVERHDVVELPRLLDRQDAVVWVDIPACDEVAVEMLSAVFGFHRIAVHDCVERNHVSKVHIYPDHVFTVLHAPQPGQRGHVHYVELDQFIGRNYLVTVHGPLNPAVDPQVAFLDTGAVRRRIEEKNLHISSPVELSHWIVSALIRRESDLVANLARESGELEQRVMLGEDLEDPEEFLEELFRAWYRLLAVRTIATPAARPTDGWRGKSASCPIPLCRCSPISPISSRQSRRWPMGSGSSCTVSSSSTRPAPRPT